MDDPATLADQLAALHAARASGARRVEYADYRVEYRTDSELAAAIADLERRLAGSRITAVRICSSKGF